MFLKRATRITRKKHIHETKANAQIPSTHLETNVESVLFPVQKVQAQRSREYGSLQPSHADLDRRASTTSVARPQSNIKQTNTMTFILPNNSSAALIRQFNDNRPYWLRVNHWLYRLCRERSETKFPSHTVTDNIHKWKKLYQSKISLGLRSEELTEERRGN